MWPPQCSPKDLCIEPSGEESHRIRSHAWKIRRDLPVRCRKTLLFDREDPERQGRADSESPEHIVHITRPYYLSTTEVTQQQFLQVTGNNPSFWTDTKLGDRSQAPVERVSWINCVEFCNLLSTGEQLEWAYRITPEQVTQTGVGGYRLPTEAEWEFACRAGTTTLFHTGNDPGTLTDAAWIFEENGRYPKPVGSKQPNAFGLSDMHGNVSEWVHDAWQPDFYQLSRDAGAVDPRCDTGIDERRIIRGGNYVFSWAEARSACREAYWAKSDLNNCAKSPEKNASDKCFSVSELSICRGSVVFHCAADTVGNSQEDKAVRQGPTVRCAAFSTL